MKKVIILLISLFLTGCTVANSEESSQTSTPSASQTTTSNTTMFTSEELNSEFDANGQTITFSNNGIESNAKGVTIADNTITITKSGTYIVSGSSSNGQIIVNSEDKATVRLVLNGLDLTSTSSPILVLQAEETIITLASGTNNTLVDSETRSDADVDYTAVIYSKDDLCVNGEGTLNVTAKYNDGITCNDTLKIVAGNYVISSVDDGIIGKDLLAINNGKFNLETQGDGLKSSNDTDASSGNIYIVDGDFTINAINDGIQAVTLLEITNGTFDITTNQGASDELLNATNETFGAGNKGFGDRGQMPDMSTAEGQAMMEERMNNKPQNGGNMSFENQPNNVAPNPTEGTPAEDSVDTTSEQEDRADFEETTTESAKGLKADGSIIIHDGTFTLNTYDDAIHSNDSILVEQGTFNIATSDDGMHADSTLTIDNGNIVIEKSYEGLEGDVVTINDGNITLTSSDDGINAASSSSNGSMMSGGTSQLIINGGNTIVNASGDGLDSNGSITMNGGYILINGPTNSGNGALDYDSTCAINGGTIVAIGQSGMMQTVSDESTNKTIVITNTFNANDVISVKDNDEEILSVTLTNSYNSVVISSDVLTANSYDVYVNGELLSNIELSSTNNYIGDAPQQNGFGGFRG